MEDHTLPMRGGWIMVKEPISLASKGGAVKINALTIIYATPVRVFVEGSFRCGNSYSAEQRFFKDQPLTLLYKERRGATLDQFEQEKLREARIHWQAWDMEEPVLEMQVKVQMETGDAVLNPHEFSIISDLSEYLACIGHEYTLVELSGMAGKGKTSDQIHYLRTRGIPRVEAFKMVAGNIYKHGMFRLEPHPGLLDYFGYKAA